MPPSTARRLLFPHLQTDTLPSLFSSPVPQDLNEECYEFIALALRAFVTPWWSKISRYDRDFLPEVARILSLVLPRLEERVLNANLGKLILRDLPSIVTQHYIDYRNAKAKLDSSYAPTSLQLLFHQAQPHVAISPDGQLDSDYYRCLLDHILPTLLPTEDSAPEVERTIVREIILKVVLQDVLPRVTEPWFILKVTSDLISERSLHPAKPVSRPSSSEPASSFSIHSLIVLFLSTVQTLSGICIMLIETYKNTLNAIKRVNDTSSNLNSPQAPLSRDLALPSLRMVSQIILADERYSTRLVFSNIYLLVGTFSTFLDRFLIYALWSLVGSPNLIFAVVRTLKKTMFPNGYPVPASSPPSPEEQEAMRNKILNFVPPGPLAHAMPLLFGPDPSGTICDALEPLSDSSCNAHLGVFLLDAILLSLFPELHSKTGATNGYTP